MVKINHKDNVIKIDVALIEKLQSMSKGILNGDYSQRIIIDVKNDIFQEIISNLNQHSDNLIINEANSNKAEKYNLNHFIETIGAFANHDFNHKLTISKQETIIDAIATGINMLGEELETTTISRDYFSNIYNAVSEILIVTDVNGYIVDLNTTTETILQIKKEDYINCDARKLIDSKNYKQIRDEIVKTFESGSQFCKFETELRDSNNKLIPVTCTLSVIYDGFNKHNGYLFVAKDISEQKNRELKEKKLIINTQEKERTRLSIDLHDSLGQEINAARMFLNSISCMDSNTDEYKKAIETCKHILDNSIEAIRDICFDLLPKSLNDGGFIYACNELIAKMNKVCIIDYNFPKFDINLSKENQTILYRIVQEFLSNSIKHSNCSKIEMKIIKNEKEVLIVISDNGTGFNINKIIKGNGLNNIISRIEALNIKYQFTSKIKKGTILELQIDQ